MPNTIEPILNAELASIFRERGFGSSSAEQSVWDLKGKRHQIDVLVDLDDRVVAIEAEFHPASTLRADAEKRLPSQPLRWNGMPIESVFEVTYPAELAKMTDAEARERLQSCSLSFQELKRGHDNSLIAGVKQSGTVSSISECLHSYWLHSTDTSSIEVSVNEASNAIEEAVKSLDRVPHIESPEGEDTLAAMALVWLNALLFQELLAANLDPDSLSPTEKQIEILPPGSSDSPEVLQEQWSSILTINWWPIFEIARVTLSKVPIQWSNLALEPLKRAAKNIATRREIRQHDIAGRIYHRLLNSRKFLATNYTTIPAAVLLARLAFDSNHPRWSQVDWRDEKSIGEIRIIDPACGTGTLLMASLQEILRNHRKAMGDKQSSFIFKKLVRIALEQVIGGYDVVPGAVHLTAATLSMAESSQVIKNIPIIRMPHDLKDRKARLGSLNFLKSSPSKGEGESVKLFPQQDDASKRSGDGGEDFIINLPPVIDLMIVNPPYTRAGGPGDKNNTKWNPIFGSVLSSSDADQMIKALKKTLNNTPASLYAGLGSAFLVLADERLGVGGRLAFVLPAVLASGSRWEALREMLLRKYELQWVISSHDPRYRNKTKTLPGRRWVSFSESTRIAEVLIVATKLQPGYDAAGVTRFVNLRRNLDDPTSAIALTRSLLNSVAKKSPVDVYAGNEVVGEMTPIPQADIGSGPWVYTTFVQGQLNEMASSLSKNGLFCFKGHKTPIPISKLGDLCTFGPYEIQAINKDQGLFHIVATEDPTRLGYPAIWHHKSGSITSIEISPNARLQRREDRNAEKQSTMLKQAGRLHIARMLGHAPQRLAAVITDEPLIGVGSWITVNISNARRGEEEALCLWLNSTLGLLLRIANANRPYLGRSGMPHERAREFPVLDFKKLSKTQLLKAMNLFSDIRSKTLKGFADLATDSVRRELDNRLQQEVLQINDAQSFEDLAQILNREPTLTARH